MKLSDLIKRIDELIAMAQEVQKSQYSDGERFPVKYVQDAPMSGLRTACLSFIERVYGKEHTHFAQFTAKTDSHFLSDLERAMAILLAIRSELSGGWLFDMKGLVAAELFSDFLDQSEHLLEQGYKDAAAVMIGSVLEEHLRQLCLRHEVQVIDLKDDKQVPRKADRLNAELARSSVYSALDSKQVTAWLGLRNDAAHGHYDRFTSEQVRIFMRGVIEFMTRVAV
ncbi:hypothetical protein [Rhodoferax bucti]|uniref:hypothetical protein n=1 Tax=Rhodoferax bucti TaxID=2576305 RepID=UPI001108FC7E|nr:hypothetical protein [Rhodoferax bucti]